MLDLKSRRWYSGVTEEIHEQLCVEVADANRFCQSVIYKLLHSLPCFLNCSVAGHHVLPIVGEAGRVALRGVDVFEGDGEMHDIEVEIIDTPVLELFFADGLHTIMIVEGVPELGD